MTIAAKVSNPGFDATDNQTVTPCAGHSKWFTLIRGADLEVRDPAIDHQDPEALLNEATHQIFKRNRSQGTHLQIRIVRKNSVEITQLPTIRIATTVDPNANDGQWNFEHNQNNVKDCSFPTPDDAEDCKCRKYYDDGGNLIDDEFDLTSGFDRVNGQIDLGNCHYFHAIPSLPMETTAGDDFEDCRIEGRLI